MGALRYVGSAGYSGTSKVQWIKQLGRQLLAMHAEPGFAAGVRKTPGSDEREVAIAAVIWQNTPMSMQWIAARLSMLSAANARQQIRRCRIVRNPLPKELQ